LTPINNKSARQQISPYVQDNDLVQPGRRSAALPIGLEVQYADRKFGNTWLDAGGAGFRTRDPGLGAEVRF
jgi:hypothetical protein